MPSPIRSETTLLLRSFGEGDKAAAEKLLPLVYDELHGRARPRTSDRPAAVSDALESKP